MSVFGGFDPGIGNLGLAVVDRMPNTYRVMHAQTVVTKPSQSLDEREAIIWQSLTHMLTTFRPLVLAIEDQTGVETAARMHRKRIAAARARGEGDPEEVGFNASNAPIQQIVGMAKGCCRAYGVRYLFVSPRSIKVAVLGSGGSRGEKGQIKHAVARFVGGENLKSHAADAVGAAIAGAQRVQLGRLR